MSARDERRAALYLERRRHYGLDGKPKVPRSKTGLALGILILLAWCGFLLVQCEAAVMPGDFVRYQQTADGLNYSIEDDGALKVAVITGALTHGSHAEEFFGVTPPTPFVFQMWFDPLAIDGNPDPTLGEYETDGARITFDFAQWHFETQTTEIRVYSGYSFRNGEIPTWGFTFGSHDEWEQNGLILGEYNGIYASFVPAHQSITPTDSLDHFINAAGNPEVETNAYVKVNGTVIPEPRPLGLLGFAVGALLFFWRR